MSAQDKGLSLDIVNLAKSYNGKRVLKQLNLQVKNGDFVAVVGRSGCGKSTLLRLLAQLEQQTTGSILTNNQALNKQHKVRLMFQDARLLPWKTVIENVGLGLSGNWRPAALKVLADVGLQNRAEDWPAALSGGQKQRVALARALISQPQLLLLDEPLGALDALTRLEMQQLISELWQQYGFTVLLVTHDINEAVVTASRVILLEQGKVSIDLPIEIARPRQNLREIAQIEQIILNKILNLSPELEDYAI